jgi:hypothetical protein
VFFESDLCAAHSFHKKVFLFYPFSAKISALPVNSPTVLSATDIRLAGKLKKSPKFADKFL